MHVISYDVLDSQATNALLLSGQGPKQTIRDHIMTLTLETFLLTFLPELVQPHLNDKTLPYSAVLRLASNVLTA